jgi:hypothetical protein
MIHQIRNVETKKEEEQMIENYHNDDERSNPVELDEWLV